MLMLVAGGKLPEGVPLVGGVDEVYGVGERVVYLAHINNPQVYADGERLSGTVIARFPNPDNEHMTYRIRLDIRYSDRIPSKVSGERVVIGNVRSFHLRRMM